MPPPPQLSLSAIRQPAFLYGPDGRVAAANDRAEALAGRPLAGCLPADVVAIFDARSPGGAPLAPADQPAARALAGEEVVDARLAVTAADGRTVHVLASASPVREGGATMGALVVWQDISALVQAEEALKRTADEHRHLVEYAPTGIFEVDYAGPRFRRVNDAMCRVLGYTREELLAMDPAKLLDEESRARLRERVRTVLAGEPVDPLVAFRLFARDGREIWAELQVSPTVTGGRVDGALVVAHDVTERRRAEEQLRESEGRYRELFDAMTEGFALHEIVLDAEGRPVDYRFLAVNPAFETSTGLEAGVAVGRRITELQPGLDLRWVERYGRVALTGEPARFTDYAAPLGRWYDVYAFSPSPGRFATIFRDVTAERETTEELRRRAEELEAVMDLVPAAIWVGHDPACRTITGNRLANEFYEAGPGENVSAGPPRGEEPSPRAFFAPDGRELAADELPMQLAAARNAVVRNAEFEVRLPSGRRRHLLGSAVPLRETDGGVRGAIAAFFDITDRKEAEEALRTYAEDLRRSNEDLERFAYVSSHDLQEPLRSIVSFSQLLERKYRGMLDADADEYIDFIVEGGTRMQTLILDLLAYSRVNTTRQQIGRTDAEDVLAGVERNLAAPLREAGGAITHDAMPMVLADPIQLEQVFANLVSNAIKFRRPDEPLRVRVGARRLDGSWEFSVSDNGIGIEAEYFDRIFVIFQRLHTKDRYEGTGIGLAIVKRIIDRHGGRVRVESTPGEGSTFFFTLPAA